MSGHITIIPEPQTAVTRYVKGLAVEWAGFARANSVSPGYVATEISDFVPKETGDIWKEKIPPSASFPSCPRGPRVCRVKRVQS